MSTENEYNIHSNAGFKSVNCCWKTASSIILLMAAVWGAYSMYWLQTFITVLLSKNHRFFGLQIMYII